ncbi:hypothetical protein PMZ80_010938 [Knufia obscura]|uniref:Uncharacterized protein n=2 Tax=Knufia TaxID=430999 RepID=A0AAN8I3Z6_9EURO|nr:hypothetical protein PMZ80_010938 [Knufia obscura]KAK5948861.1 hypothetical protein OHC33_010112 [Knufia fluminis]
MISSHSLQAQASQALSHLKASLQPNFYRLHLGYFVTAILVSSAILWAANTDDFHVRYVDALFLCCSAMCNVGLNTVNLGSLNALQQSVLFIMMLMGDLSLVTISVVVIRRHYFAKYMKEFIQHSKAGRRIAEDVERSDHASTSSTESTSMLRPRRQQLFQNGQTRPSVKKPPLGHVRSQHASGYGGFPTPWDSGLSRKLSRYLHTKLGGDQTPKHPYLSSEPKLDHKGRFHSLTREQEQEIGGVEYRALQLLTWLLPAYAMFWLLLTIVVMTPYVLHTNAGNVIRTSQPGNLNPAWWSIFASVSAYTNCGLNLLNQNMIPLNNNYLILIFTGMVILTGNTLYPVFLRGSIWLLSKLVPKGSETHHTLMFLLHHPRRCYLFLFPAKNTYILLLTQIAINLTAWVLFILLNINYTPVDPSIPPGLRIFQGLYQAHGLRASGFYIINISDVAPALQFFYMVAMYISAFPIIMSVRTTNIYEERSIGQDDESKSQAALNDQDKREKADSNLRQHLQRQLAYDLWWIVGCVWLVSIIERDKLAPSPPAALTVQEPRSLPSPHPAFSNGLFAILFETMSAYGTVGLSLSVPYDDYSFSGAWQSASKLILMMVMLRGRHRILPMAIDRAVLLPGQGTMEELDKKFRAHAETEGEWERDEEEIREEERGSDAEDGQASAKGGKSRSKPANSAKGKDEDEDE